MICPQCGLPVSPSRKSCPRCGISVEEIRERIREKSRTGQGAIVSPSILSSPHQQEEGKRRQQGEEVPSRAENKIQQSSVIQTAYPQQRKILAGLFPGTFFNKPSKIRLGFTVAGICIGAGALILILVFIMAQSLPAPTRTGAQVQPIGRTEGNNVRNQGKATAISPTPSPLPSPTASSITPETTGSKYVDNVQIGTAIDMNRVQVAQSTRDFKAGQRIYITMSVNSIGYQGAVCLDWYVQNAFLTHYAFSTMADPSMPHAAAWSYAVSTRSGPGYVNVFWASSLACADKALAQRVDFNIDG